MSDIIINEESNLKKKVWKIINIIQSNQLFIHSKNLDIKYYPEGKKRIEKKILPEILTICILNALVPNSAILLIGGHGGGKSSLVKLLGRMFTSKSLADIENAIVRGHPQLTEEKLVGTLRLGKLMKDGVEEVIWKSFIIEFWKIIDEVNRLTPYTQDILLSLLAEGTVKYYDSVYNIDKFCLYGTINPQDIGTFKLSKPFLDRFGISIPISMPASQDLKLILTGKDEKYSGYDESIQVPGILKIDELMEIWYQVNQIQIKEDANNYIHAIVREYTLCDRIEKGHNNKLKPSTGLCSGCHFNTNQNVCNKIDTILSVRVAKDLLRYSRALAWLLNIKLIDVLIVNIIAPYVIAHRSEYSEREIEKAPYWGDKYFFTKELLSLIQNKFIKRKICYEITSNFRNGIQNEEELNELKKFRTNDLIVKYDLYPFIERINNKKYSNLAQKIHNASKNGLIDELGKIRNMILNNIELPNRADLIHWCNRELYHQTVTNYIFKYSYWKEIWADIAIEFPNLDALIKDAFQKRQTKQIRTEDLLIEINVTGTKEESLVNIQISGGSDALKLKSILENSEYIQK
ncbi:MAG: AAA family ATPase [Candidatus Lokiarchaeota archaeon]|nr:AAA family ATPase [Candidatus Lokiarchaeota archaeon]